MFSTDELVELTEEAAARDRDNPPGQVQRISYEPIVCVTIVCVLVLIFHKFSKLHVLCTAVAQKRRTRKERPRYKELEAVALDLEPRR
jgi:hypothetical protein